MIPTQPYPAGIVFEKQSERVTNVRISEFRPDWHLYFLVTSDRHLDSKSSNWSLQKHHLEQAQRIGAPVLDFGDLFDLMQTPRDRRASKSAVKECLSSDEYYDDTVDHVAGLLEPYADTIKFIGIGNHESAIIKHLNSNPIRRVCDKLRDRTGADIIEGGYSGYIRFLFTFDTTKRQTVVLRYHHGSGGSSPVTKGVIQTNRRAVWVPDADILISGHTHQDYRVPIIRERIGNTGVIRHDIQLHVQVPSYKSHNPVKSRNGGYEEEREFAPTRCGAYWLVFSRGKDGRVKYDAVMAQ